MVLLKKTTDNYVWYNLGARIQSQENTDVYQEVFANADTWLRGNVFLGPANKGPFDPTFDTDEENFDAFEEDAELIVGQERYDKLKQLFYNLHLFSLWRYVQFPLWRLLNGLEHFVDIFNLIVIHETTPMNEQQWEFRQPTDEELTENIESEDFRGELRS